MQRRILGRTRISASEISLGTVELGLDYGIAAAVGNPPPRGGRSRTASAPRARPRHQPHRHRARPTGIVKRSSAGTGGEAVRIPPGVESPDVPGLAPDERRCQMEASVEESARHLRTQSLDLLLLHSGASDDLSAAIGRTFWMTSRTAAHPIHGGQHLGNSQRCAFIPASLIVCRSLESSRPAGGSGSDGLAPGRISG